MHKCMYTVLGVVLGVSVSIAYVMQLNAPETKTVSTVSSAFRSEHERRIEQKDFSCAGFDVLRTEACFLTLKQNT